MQRLFSFLLILRCLYIHLHLLSFVKADDAFCNATTQSQQCANLSEYISYPYGDVAPCISNCSSLQTYWEALTQASSSEKLKAPSVTGIFQEVYWKFINLTWNLPFSQIPDVCIAPSVKDVDTYIPRVINLTSFVNGSFQLSAYNQILLLGCSGLPSSSPSDVQISSPICTNYLKQCGGSLEDIINIPCAQIKVPTKELMLKDALDRYSCTNFQFLLTVDNTTTITSWTPGLVQLYGDVRCEPCYSSGGICLVDKVNNHQCDCGKNKYTNTDCRLILSCAGLSCNTRAKIIIGVTGVVIATVVTVIGIVALNYHRKRRDFFTRIVPFRSEKRSTRHKLFGSSSLMIDLDGLTERPIVYEYASLVLATKSFSNLLGEGGFGAVYKGTLAGDAKDDAHVQIAVKVLEVRSKHSKNQFFNEVASIGRIHHVHVVRLLGFCIEENHEMLVYEYVINGSLDKWLFHCSDTQNRVLLWEQRYAIAIGIAKGLNYLHEECRHRIVHCDIKPQNILLDEQMRPKIADFGLAKLMGREVSRVMTLAKGTPGYMGPEFWLGGESQLSTKLDVYSYGMVLLELISGQQNFRHGIYFPETAFEAAMGGDFESIMDVKLDISKTADGILDLDGIQQLQQVQTALLVALWCIQDNPVNRPSMSEVVQYLEGTAAVNEQPPRPRIASHISSIAAQQHSYLSNDIHYDITQISGGR